ncbi:ABC transporter ATP-binding protein [Spiroplasma chinense]|uniref:ABC transporter ATP-binding protein n=1 Tax=Spiroplasma chinense TaxID=216932 RepID=A0A5B9Y5J5_9MOLU|nr:ATP-binding cassette domain-containing protein [Spiroplasma chinense]QEH62095.1 ABC transporter ATP-binding protein [Spiroplasma chinense]
MENKELMVVLENVSKIFDKKIWAIKKVNIKIFKGDGVAIIGPNQSGKTIFGRLIANQIVQTGGIIEYNFEKGDTMSSIGFQFRNTSWPDGFKVKDIVSLYIDIYNIRDEEWLDELANVFHITERWDKVLNSCNASWLQLFSLYLAFIHKPELIVLDEVSNAIGLDMKAKVIAFLKKYKEEHNATFVIMSPNNSLFESLCNRIVVMHSGMILSDDYTDSLEEGFNFEEYTVNLMESIEQEKSQPQPDPVFKPILRKFNLRLEKFYEIYEHFIKNENISENLDIDKTLVKVKNINFHVQELHNKLIFLASNALNKTNVDNVKLEIKILIKHIKKAIRENKKNDDEYLFKKPVDSFLKKIKPFLVYLKDDLLPMFKTDSVIVYGNEITAELSKKEIQNLRFLKKKYIQEEIRIMKLEAKIAKQRERHKKIEG